MPKNILIVDSDQNILSFISNLLGQSYRIVWVSKINEAVHKIKNAPVDLIILDFELPDGSGLELCNIVRRGLKLVDIPIVFLTQRNIGSELRADSFDFGADDFLEKTSHPKELKARIERRIHCLRRDREKAKQRLQLGNIRIDVFSQRAFIQQDQEVDLKLTRSELTLLMLFIQNPGDLFQKEALRKFLWGNDQPENRRTIDMHVNKLARKMDKLGASHQIKTIRALGYQCVPRSIETQLDPQLI